jgi:Ca2+-binding EF-hand superfamily protein
MEEKMQSDRDSRESIMNVFHLFDDDGSGKISIRNLKRVARELGETMTGMQAPLQSPSISRD